MRARGTFAMLALLLLAGTASGMVVETSPSGSPVERLAAQELQRYVYLRTGELPSIDMDRADTPRIVVARKDRDIVRKSGIRDAVKALCPQQYVLRTTSANGRKTWWVVGGDDIGALYGAYRFAEKIGVRFYLHGDVIPDERIKSLPDINEVGKPLFSIRGIQPFHDFPEGPDWWNTGDYLAYIAQLPKLRMNFIGLHCYPESGVGPEPAVWIGVPDDADKDGHVRRSYPSHWASTMRDGPWGYSAMPTSEFTCGASLLFTDDGYGPDVLEGVLPRPATQEECNAVFDRTADMFRTAFSHARRLGVKTCIGTETPLTIPTPVRERLKEQGRDPKDPAVVEELYRGIFRRIACAYPVDYYWLWTPEGWTWGGNSDEDLKATMSDIRAALSALDGLGRPFTLATCGWVLGPVQDRRALDAILPKGSPMSCINRSVGHAPVEPSFAGIEDRPKWAIPWVENDPVLTAPQPWVGRMRYDAADAKRLGCTGLLGIHWRTKVLSQNFAALADAAWDQSWVPAGFAAESEKKLDDLDGPIGGKLAGFTAPVEATDEDPIYQVVRYDVDGYRLKVPNGRYTVVLKFNEPHYGESGKRVFGISLQGRRVIDSLDMFARVGKNKALDFEYPDTRVTGGVLRIDLARIVEFPCIAGITVDGTTDDGKHFTRKINCGGARYAAYEADNNQPDDNQDRRSMPIEAFYVDFARANFGDSVAAHVGKILTRIDGRGLPEPVGWIGGPGGLRANGQPWETVKAGYSFVEELAFVAPEVRGAGNRERFGYWLNTYRYMATSAELGCLRGALDAQVVAIKAEQDPAKRKALAEEALKTRVSMSRVWERMMTHQLAAVDTPGDLGTVANLEQHSRKTLGFLTGHDELLAQALGRPIPAEAEVSHSYTGPARIIVPTVRTQLTKGEDLRLRVIVLDKGLPKTAAIYWRPLGTGKYRRVDLKNIGRAVFEADLQPADRSFEYYVAAETTDDRKLVWPASAPRMNQTVVVWGMPAPTQGLSVRELPCAVDPVHLANGAESRTQ